MTPVKAYGDKLDGRIQVAFTLNYKMDARSEAVGLAYAAKLGLTEVLITSTRSLGEYTAYIAFGCTRAEIDLDAIVVEPPEYTHRTRDEIEALAANWQPLRVVGAALESDAHTVGLDAILNMKGYHGDYGLERYACFEVHNLGAQVLVAELIAAIRKHDAQVVLISQTVSQNGIHLRHLAEFRDELRKHPDLDVLVLVGGMHVTNTHAKELGFAGGFGRGTTPSMVASQIIDEASARQGWVQERTDDTTTA